MHSHQTLFLLRLKGVASETTCLHACILSLSMDGKSIVMTMLDVVDWHIMQTDNLQLSQSS